MSVATAVHSQILPTRRPTEPIEIPAKRSWEPESTPSFGSLDSWPRPPSPDLIFDMDPISYDFEPQCSKLNTLTSPHRLPPKKLVQDEPYLHTFPIVPSTLTTPRNNGQSTDSTPSLSPSSSTTSASSSLSSSESFVVPRNYRDLPSLSLSSSDPHTTSTASTTTQAPPAVLVFRSTPATKITGFTPYVPDPSAQKQSHVSPPRPRHPSVVACPNWQDTRSRSGDVATDVLETFFASNASKNNSHGGTKIVNSDSRERKSRFERPKPKSIFYI